MGDVHTNNLQLQPSLTLLDPFCGSGTVLTEGINLGIKKLIGTDLSDKCISDTEQNVKWMLHELKINPEPFHMPGASSML
jgi:tRNA G10  N-methylase Trm11